MPTPFIPGRNPNKREENEMKKYGTMKCPNCFRVLHTSTPRLYTSPRMADQDSLGETGWPDHWCFQAAPSVPSLCICSFNCPIGWDNAASNSTTYSWVCGRLPIPLFPRLSLGVVLKLDDIWLTVYNDQEATHGKHCGSIVYLARQICMHGEFMILVTVCHPVHV